MFKHNYKYVLKILLRTRSMIFWLLLFPIALSTLFFMAFSDIENQSTFKAVDVAIIKGEKLEKNPLYINTLNILSNEDNKILNITYSNKEDSLKLLEDKKVSAVVELLDKPKIYVKKDGYQETVVKSVIDQMYEMEETFNIVLKSKLAKGEKEDSNLYIKIVQELSSSKDWLNNISKKGTHPIVLSYYTVLAMAASYGATLGLFIITEFNANKSKKGARMEITPLHKLKLLTSAFLASFTVLSVILILSYLYLNFVLKVNFNGISPFHIIGLLLAGGLSGLSSGMMIGSVVRKNMDFQIGLVISITMFFSVLAGMMSYAVKRLVDSSIPILNRINPVNLVSDGFYSLYYFNDLNRYYSNIINLLIITVITLGISYLFIRSENYDSI